MIRFLFIILCFSIAFNCFGQETGALDSIHTTSKDSLIVQSKDTVSLKSYANRYNPTKALLYAAVLPGLGQIYNKKYWKVPIVYTAIGIPAYLFFDNKKWYERTNYAYAVALEPNPSQDSLNAVHPDLRPLVDRKATTALVNYRNDFRKNMDYCVLFFLLAWALNIVDATVDAHLKDFNVSPDLSLRIKPVMTNNNYGVGLALDFHKSKTPVKTAGF